MTKLLKSIIIILGVFGFIIGCSSPLTINSGATTTTIKVIEDEKVNDSKLNLGLYIAGRELTQRVESPDSPWNKNSVISGYYPIYTPGIEGVSHYEFKIKTDNKDAGYILVSVTENDIEIPEMSEEGLTTTEIYRNALNTDDFKVVRYNWFESAAESTTRGFGTKVLATMGFNGMGLTVINQTRGNDGFEEEYKNLKESYAEKLVEKQCLPFYDKKSLEDFYKNIYMGRNSITRGNVEPPKIISAERQLHSRFTSDSHLPKWSQPTRPDGHPMGCTNVAWAMVFAYWKEFKGKSNLFGGYNLRIGDRWTEQGYSTSSSDPIYKAMCDIASYCLSQGGGVFVGNTYLGLKYAGFSEPSTCYGTGVFVWSSGYTNPNGVWDEISDDRPVMLCINSSGQGILNHTVVIDGMIKEYWNNTGAITQVRYHVNFGWGGYQKWIHFYNDGYTSIYDAFFVRLY